MSTPAVTIGISFKNPGTYFQLALQSVFAQSFEDWELILIDDGTTDGSGEVAAALKDSRVQLHRDGSSRTLNIRLNQMVRMARGKYFFRMDADDVMHPERVARQLEVLEQVGDNAVVGTGAFSIDGSSRVVGVRQSSASPQSGFAARHRFIHPTVAAPRDWFLRNPYSEDFIYHRAQDAELWCRTSGTSRFHLMAEPLLFYRESDTFSFPNYLGTSMGILHLAHRYADSKYAFLKHVTVEIGKIWLTTVLYGCGHVDVVANKRFRPLADDARSEAQAILDLVASYPLPQTCGLSAA